MISIVTPSYNRAHLLPRLYESLKKQDSVLFEWIIVDDGSVDNTQEVVSSFFVSDLDITYHYKNNGGKHTALNIGVDLAKYPYTFIVDSDDFLPQNAISNLLGKINYIQKQGQRDHIAGVCGLKVDVNGGFMGKEYPDMICNYLDFRYRHKITGDKAEIFKTDILREFKFPEYEGEKFCPEALVWNRIASKYDMFFFYENIYFCEYQKEGLTSQIYNLRKRSPKATLLYYKELFYNKRIPIFYRFRALVNYFRFYLLS